MSIQEHSGNIRSVAEDCENIIDQDDDEIIVDCSDTEENRRTGTSWFSAIFLVVNAALGAGLLNFPDAYNQAGGIVVAVIVQAIVVGFVIAALLILAFCSDLRCSSTYQDVVLHMCGRRAQQLCALGVAVYCYGTCITFLIIIGDQFDRVLSSLYGSDFCHHWYMHRDFTMTVSSVIFILPLCFPRRIDFLKYASLLGVFSIIYVVFLIIYQFYMETYPRGEIKTSPDTWSDVFLVVPVICFGYQCHVSVIPIYSCLRERSLQNFSKTVIVAIVICMLTYTVAATYGYLTFGSLVPSDVLEAYDATTPIVLIGIVALAIKTFTTYPILQFCGRVAIDGLWIEMCGLSSFTVASKEKGRRIIITLVWFTTSVAFAIIIPNIGSVISLLGSLAAVFIFVFPGLCWIQATLKKDPHLFLLVDRLVILTSCAFIVIGAFLFGLVFTQAIQSDVTTTPQKNLLCS